MEDLGGGPLTRLLLFALALATVYSASLVVFPIHTVEVSGLKHLTKPGVEAATSLFPGKPWLWVTAGDLDTLKQNPWVLAAHLTRPSVGVVHIQVQERTPAAILDQDGKKSLAADGTVLPGGALTGPVISGFGRDRLKGALSLLAVFPGSSAIYFTPAGYTVHWRGRIFWASDTELLRTMANRVRMEPDARVALYSWGVSLLR